MGIGVLGFLGIVLMLVSLISIVQNERTKRKFKNYATTVNEFEELVYKPSKDRWEEYVQMWTKLVNYEITDISEDTRFKMVDRLQRLIEEYK